METEDILLKRYGAGAEYVLNMDYQDGIEIITYATDKVEEELLFLRWVALYQSSMTFEEFIKNIDYKREEKNREQNMNVDEILDKVQKIIG